MSIFRALKARLKPRPLSVIDICSCNHDVLDHEPSGFCNACQSERLCSPSTDFPGGKRVRGI